MYWDGESSPSVETPIGDFFRSDFSIIHIIMVDDNEVKNLPRFHAI